MDQELEMWSGQYPLRAPQASAACLIHSHFLLRYLRVFDSVGTTFLLLNFIPHLFEFEAHIWPKPLVQEFLWHSLLAGYSSLFSSIWLTCFGHSRRGLYHACCKSDGASFFFASTWLKGPCKSGLALKCKADGLLGEVFLSKENQA